MQIITLEKSELEDIIRRTAAAVADEFRKDRVVQKEWMTKAELAAHWNLSPATINRYMNEGMPFDRVGNGHPSFRLTAVSNWRANERNETLSRKEANVQI
jgi:hypothetical protein